MKYKMIIITFIIIIIVYTVLYALTYTSGKDTIIPKFVWQTYKIKDLPIQALQIHNEWISKNPGWNVALYDDDDIDSYIKSNWDTRMYTFFRALPLGVMKADLWRYLMLTTHGGVYSDIDSKCLLPINQWFHDFIGPNALVIGLENDTHFCQWNMYCTKEHPIMIYVCNFILENYEREGIDIKYEHCVHATTGPGIWTDAIKSYLNLDKLNAKEIYSMYKTDKSYFNEKGIYILSVDYFHHIYTNNEYGSNNYGDGYIKWTDEKNKLIDKAN